jgi:hypothetical protein
MLLPGRWGENFDLYTKSLLIINPRDPQVYCEEESLLYPNQIHSIYARLIVIGRNGSMTEQYLVDLPIDRRRLQYVPQNVIDRIYQYISHETVIKQLGG